MAGQGGAALEPQRHAPPRELLAEATAGFVPWVKPCASLQNRRCGFPLIDALLGGRCHIDEARASLPALCPAAAPRTNCVDQEARAPARRSSCRSLRLTRRASYPAEFQASSSGEIIVDAGRVALRLARCFPALPPGRHGMCGLAGVERGPMAHMHLLPGQYDHRARQTRRIRRRRVVAQARAALRIGPGTLRPRHAIGDPSAHGWWSVERSHEAPWMGNRIWIRRNAASGSRRISRRLSARAAVVVARVRRGARKSWSEVDLPCPSREKENLLQLRLPRAARWRRSPPLWDCVSVF